MTLWKWLRGNWKRLSGAALGVLVLIAAVSFTAAVTAERDARKCLETGKCKSELIQRIKSTPPRETDVEQAIQTTYASMAKAVGSNGHGRGRPERILEAAEQWEQAVNTANAECVRDEFAGFLAQSELDHAVAGIVVEGFALMDSALTATDTPADPLGALVLGGPLLDDGMASILTRQLASQPVQMLLACDI